MSPAPKGLSDGLGRAGSSKPLTLEEYRRAIAPPAAPGPQASSSNPPPAPSSRSQSASSAHRTREKHADPFFPKVDPTGVTYRPARSVVASQLEPPAQICVRRNAYGELDSYTEEVTLYQLRQYAERSASASDIGNGSAAAPDWHREPLRATKEPPKSWRKGPPAYLAARPTPRSLHIRQNFVETQRKKAEHPKLMPKSHETVEDSMLYGPPIQSSPAMQKLTSVVPPPSPLPPQASTKYPQATPHMWESTNRDDFVTRQIPETSPLQTDRRTMAPTLSPQGNQPTPVEDVEISPPTPAALRARQQQQQRPAASPFAGGLAIPSMRVPRPDLFQGHSRPHDAPSPEQTPAAILEHLEMQLQRRADIPSRPPPPEPHARIVPAQPRLDGADSVHDAAESARALLAQLTSRQRYSR